MKPLPGYFASYALDELCTIQSMLRDAPFTVFVDDMLDLIGQAINIIEQEYNR